MRDISMEVADLHGFAQESFGAIEVQFRAHKREARYRISPDAIP
jgi:hypothetical protein